MCKQAAVSPGHIWTTLYNVTKTTQSTYMNDKLHKSNKLREIKWHPYAFTDTIEIQTLSTGDKSLKVRQEYNINVGKTSLTKRNITA